MFHCDFVTLDFGFGAVLLCCHGGFHCDLSWRTCGGEFYVVVIIGPYAFCFRICAGSSCWRWWCSGSGAAKDLVLVSGGFGVVSPSGGDVSDGVGLIYRKGEFIYGRVFGW
jgi:hypothetical protein